MEMSIRAKILTHSLPLLPTQSFTRQTLSLALSRLPSDHPDHQAEPVSETVLDTVFGDGNAASKALVQRWEEEGVDSMLAESSSTGRILEARLKSRLTHSAEVGEHLVEVSNIPDVSLSDS